MDAPFSPLFDPIDEPARLPQGGRTRHVADAVAGLQVDAALSLLQQAGLSPPAGDRDTPGWLQSLIDALCELSSRDALTGLSNRRSFERALEREVDRVARMGEATLVLMLDIDHFKRVNDTWGHSAGDEVIKAIARALADSVRPMDTVARMGGEEFAVILPNCAPAFGQTLADRLRRLVEGMQIAISPVESIGVTISVGGAFAPQWVRSSASLWLERADRKLYQAKSEGRNRVCLDLPPVSQVSAEEKGLLFGTSQFQDLP